jgi:hypothetical protein
MINADETADSNLLYRIAPPLLFGEAGRAPVAVSIMPRGFPQGIGIMTGTLSQNMNIRLE